MATYLEKTRSFVTSSKLKDFSRCERLYYVKWILEKAEEEETTDALTFGQIVDDFVSWGEEEFWDKYTILEPKKHRQSKYDITNSDGKKLLEIIEEIKRQPLFLNTKDYRKQELIECEYKGLKLCGRLDRYSPELKMIRDTKTAKSHSGEFHYSDSFANQAFQYLYPFSMAFYTILAKIRDGVDCEVGLDVFAKNNGVYRYYSIDNSILIPEKHRIISLLDSLSTKKKEEDYLCEPDMDVCLRCPMARHCKQTIQTEPQPLLPPEIKY